MQKGKASVSHSSSPAIQPLHGRQTVLSVAKDLKILKIPTLVTLKIVKDGGEAGEWGESKMRRRGIQLGCELQSPGPWALPFLIPLSADPKRYPEARGLLRALQPSLPWSCGWWPPGLCPKADIGKLTFQSGVGLGQMNFLLSSECRPLFEGRWKLQESSRSWGPWLILNSGILKLILSQGAAVGLWLLSVFNLLTPLGNCVWSGNSVAFKNNFQMVNLTQLWRMLGTFSDSAKLVCPF